ncbi:MAG: Abi family protein [Bacteroidaceae bacterium]|nr:Abi family protein [Bacteroidaceae bacterium]
MDFKTSQKLYSVARMNKYAKACAYNKRRTMQLYRYNLRSCQRFYGILHLFEVMLRNAINEHYTSYFSDSDWITNQANNDGLLTYNKDEIKQTEAVYRKREIYSNDKMVASLTMGFWTKLFSKSRYREGGKTLLRIFPNKSKGKNQSDIYKDLTHIREFRNRIAHHEPICFDATGNIDTTFARKHYQLICDYISYMGFQPENVLNWAEKPDGILDRIDKLVEY